MQHKDTQQLLKKYLAGQCSEDEKAALELWYVRYEQKGLPEISQEVTDEAMADVWSRLPVNRPPVVTKRLWPRIAAAASILMVLGAGTFVVINRQNKVSDMSGDIAPYTAMATLKSGGKTILIDKTANGKIGNTIVTKSPGEQLSYANASEKYTAIYDTLQIPAGGRPYTVKLADGSKITLNAATTLRYPEMFSKNRKEEIDLISGEIYAAVVHDPAAPLQIKAPGQIITDIGTEFDIAAYPDEPDSRTTLVEGAVKVNAAGKETTLSPGNQAILKGNNLTSSVANLMQVASWKNGLFRFNGEHIDAVMRQLSRWYNIDVKYGGAVTEEVFYGRVSRTRNISEVLRILERSKKVHFKVEGRRVTVLSNS